MNDEELVLKAIEGDQKSFEELVYKYEKLVYSICYKMFKNDQDSLDFTQETFIKVYKNMSNAIGKGSFKSWICTIATNTCIDELRKRKNKYTLSLDDTFENDSKNAKIDPPDKSPTPLEKIIEDENSELLAKAIGNLSEDNKSIIIMRDVEGYSYDEIAKFLGISLGTVKSRISRARKKLQKNYIELMELN